VALIGAIHPPEQRIVDKRTSMAVLPHIPIPSTAPLYSDYIAHIQSKSQEEDMNYWKVYLAGIEQCHFPSLTDGGRGEKELKSFVLDLAQTSELQSFCTKHGVTLSNVLQFAWALTLRSYTGSTDVCFGYLSSGRDVPIPDIQGSAVGAFINMLTCRISLNEDLRLSQALQQIQSDFVHSMAHQSCSLADVQHELGLSGASLFNTAFTFQKRQTSTRSDDSPVVFDVIETHDPSEYDVTVNVEAFETEIKVHFGYWGNILCETQAQNVADTFDHVVNGVVSSQLAVSTVGAIDFLTEYSRQQVNNWNSSLAPKVDRCIHEMIAQQKVERPMATQAVSAWDGDLTFTELDEMTTRLAPLLIELGVGPEVYVPLCFEKSKFAVVAMIAVMKAAG
jgi:non-ribosomal peptide synthetase component F